MNIVRSHTPLVSIIINNYNYGSFIAQAIDSALNQTYSPIEVIVVDDGSTDNSREIITSYGDKITPVLKKMADKPQLIMQVLLQLRDQLFAFSTLTIFFSLKKLLL